MIPMESGNIATDIYYAHNNQGHANKGEALLALAKIVDRKGVPFGPFMVAGALVGVLLGPWTAANLG